MQHVCFVQVEMWKLYSNTAMFAVADEFCAPICAHSTVHQITDETATQKIIDTAGAR